MNLLELTSRNIKRNFRLYTIYLVSMIIGVIIQFTFSALMYNDDIINALKNKESFKTGVSIATVVIFLFIIFFILYSNSFFMKQRKKEFGMYLLYGMSEAQITLMIFYENLFIGGISLVIGMLIGGLLSKFFGMLLMNLMKYNEVISLNFPIEAIASTVGLFILLAIIISIQSFFMIRRVQIVELFHAQSKKEKTFKSSPFFAILSIVLLGIAVYLITSGKESVFWKEHVSFTSITVTIGLIGGTYLFFRQFTGWLLQVFSNRKRFYEGNTVLWVSSLRFQIRSNTLNLTFITLFSAVLILLIGFVTINYKVQFEAVGINLPNDIAFQTIDKNTSNHIHQMIKNSNHPIEEYKQIEGLVSKTKSNRAIAFENPQYFTKEILLFSEKDYNKIVTMHGKKEKVHLKGMEAVSLSQGSDFPKVYPVDHQPKFTITTKQDQTFNLVEKKDYALLGWGTDPGKSMIIKPSILIISNEAYGNIKKQSVKQGFEIYQIKDVKNAEELSKKIHAIVTKTPNAYYSSFADVYSKQIESSSLVLFSACFLAIIALFALASVIYFKQLREATEEQRLYAILRKIGTTNNIIKSVIRKQLLFVFMPPLLLGVMHSWLILKYYMLDSVKGFPGLTSIIIGVLISYTLIYILFYLSSTSIYYKIVNQKR
ncbi:FtsX-like permease family protein [Bacillus sp. AFS017336]|uniref:FtsX-like permease family protein n=1 Tax=Bacillus sp. AFS017336 TaxID=2033489 RepID=UPI000BEFEC36|nr:ABC transporter permease [Bacillus sp. AFS017336]PEL08136.1 ABC transporter permease [Bacillus sp. AFS017336]